MVDTEFVYSWRIVGREAAPTHPSPTAALIDNLTFPPAAIGQPISVQIVTHTHVGTVTLDWPIKVRDDRN
jgi:hypothetical protein